MKLTKEEKKMILLCLERLWDCYNDSSFFEDHERGKENIRQILIERFKKELGIVPE